MRSSRFFGKIGARLFFTFTILLVLLTLFGGLVALVMADRAIRENASNELRVVSVTLARRVQRQLDRIEEGLTSMEKHGFLVTELSKPTADRKAIEIFLNNKLGGMPLFLELAIFNREGECIGATNPSWYTIKAKNKAFFATGLRSFNFSEMFTTEEGSIQLVSSPVNNGNSSRGVLVGQMNLEVIYELMDQTVEDSDSGDVFLLDSGLRYITTGKTGTEDLRESHLSSTPLVKHLKEEFWVGRYLNFDGEEVLGTSIRVPGRQWYVVLERSFNEVSRPIDGVRVTIIAITFCVLLVLILTTFFLTRSITRPLNDLVEGAKRIADGDFKHRVVIPGGPEEVLFLAKEFEKMRGRVEEYQSMLLGRLEVSERRLIESERLAAIGTLAATMAHEIRNPLNAMSLLLSRVELAGSGFNKSADFSIKNSSMISDMRGEIDRLERLVNDILDYAKPLNINHTSFDLAVLVRSMLDRYRGVFEGKGIQVAFSPTVDDCQVWMDSDKILQCLTNVIQNAIDAIQAPTGTIDVTLARRSDGWIDLTVVDSGVGLPAGKEGHLFDLFFTTKERGTGLGLSNVMKIVDAHGGRILLRPRLPVNGVSISGTEVVFSFPAFSP